GSAVRVPRPRAAPRSRDPLPLARAGERARPCPRRGLARDRRRPGRRRSAPLRAPPRLKTRRPADGRRAARRRGMEMGGLVSPCARTSTPGRPLGVSGANLGFVGKVRRFAPYLGLATVVLGLLVYLGISYRVADGVTKLERQPLSRPAETV